MKWLVRYAFVALLAMLSTFFALVQVGKFEAAVAMLEIVVSVYLVLILACMVAKRIWRRSK